MERRFELVENERRQFVVPVQLTWTAPDGALHTAWGETVDASVYGLGVVIDTHITADTEVTVALNGVVICGKGNIRYSHALDSGFRTGLQFQVTLVMQGLPELDAILMTALKPRAVERFRHFASLRGFFKSAAA